MYQLRRYFKYGNSAVIAIALMLAACSGDGDGGGGEGDEVDTMADAGGEVESEKIGVVVIAGGMDEDYKPDCKVGYLKHLFPFFGYGFYAGSPLEGGDCYTLIHFANEAEATICGVAEGTPIDIFCNEYTNLDQYPVHPLQDHVRDGSFRENCSTVGFLPFVIGGHTTIDPVTGEEIEGPVVDDPNGPGIGIADFIEQSAFGGMEEHYVHFKDYKRPSRRQRLKWIYGDDVPAMYNYEPDPKELTNIKDTLNATYPEHEFVVRHGWEAYMDNEDIYGNPAQIPDSTETVLEQLIVDENVDRLIVLASVSHYTNVTNYGVCWIDGDGQGVSAIPGNTYKDCVADLDDGVGPRSQDVLDQLLVEKPWSDYHSPNVVIDHMAKGIDPTVNLAFTRAYGDYPEYNQAILEMLKYTVEKFSIPTTDSLKVIIAFHGFAGGHLDGAACDSYKVGVNSLSTRLLTDLNAYLDASWQGNAEAAYGETEMAQPGDNRLEDMASPNKPFGSIMSTGELIDQSINGTWVNELGEVVDNGTDNYDYVIVLPATWDAEGADTIVHFRGETLGNHELGQIQGTDVWIRQHSDQSGEEYDPSAFDDQYFTKRLMDASGWGSVPAAGGEAVLKGSATNPTTVILTGTILSLGEGPFRESITQAAVRAIGDAIADPTTGGWIDEECMQ